MNQYLFAFAISAFTWLASTVQAETGKELQDDVMVAKYAPATGSFPGCTHIAFNNATEVVTTGDQLFYRTDPKSLFQKSPIQGFTDAHSVVFNPVDQLYYATDTGNQRLITFGNPAKTEVRINATSLAGIKLKRPHVIVFDRSTNWLYTINPDSSQLFRFKAGNQSADMLDLSQQLGYSRALTMAEGKLYVVGSSAGSVVEIDDFDEQQ